MWIPRGDRLVMDGDINEHQIELSERFVAHTRRDRSGFEIRRIEDWQTVEGSARTDTSVHLHSDGVILIRPSGEGSQLTSMSSDLAETRWQKPLTTRAGQPLSVLRRQLWTTSATGRRSAQFIDIDCSDEHFIVLARDDVWDDRVAVADLATGNVLWDVGAGGVKNALIASDVALLIRDFNGMRVEAFDLGTGRPLWDVRLGENGNMADVGDAIFLASPEPHWVRLVEPRTGRELVTVRPGVTSFLRVPARSGMAFTDSDVSYLVTHAGEHPICTGRLISGNEDVLVAQDDDRMIGWQVNGTPSWEAQLPDATEVVACGSLRWSDFVVFGQGDQLTWVEAKSGDAIAHAVSRQSGGRLTAVSPTAAVVAYDDGIEVIRPTTTKARMLEGLAREVTAWRRVELGTGRARPLTSGNGDE